MLCNSSTKLSSCDSVVGQVEWQQCHIGNSLSPIFLTQLPPSALSCRCNKGEWATCHVLEILKKREVVAGALLSWLPTIFSPETASKPKTGLKNLPPQKNPKFSHTQIYLSSLNRELLNHNLHLDLHDEGGPLDVEAGRPVHLPDGGCRADLPCGPTSPNLCLFIFGKLFGTWELEVQVRYLWILYIVVIFLYVDLSNQFNKSVQTISNDNLFRWPIHTLLYKIQIINLTLKMQNTKLSPVVGDWYVLDSLYFLSEASPGVSWTLVDPGDAPYPRSQNQNSESRSHVHHHRHHYHHHYCHCHHRCYAALSMPCPGHSFARFFVVRSCFRVSLYGFGGLCGDSAAGGRLTQRRVRGAGSH